MSEATVLLHGIWMPGSEMLFIKHRLESEHGFDCHLFSYASVRGTLDDNAAKLARFAADLGMERVHLIGHSLGGIVALRMLSRTPDAAPGRVVCLGSPLRGSAAAENLGSRKWGKVILGHTLPAGAVTEPASVWARDVVASRDVGVIAGTLPSGVGRLFARFGEDNDGTVAVSETRLPGVKDHLVLHVSHTGMILSREVADQAAAFVKRGEFLREDRPPQPVGNGHRKGGRIPYYSVKGIRYLFRSEFRIVAGSRSHT